MSEKTGHAKPSRAERKMRKDSARTIIGDAAYRIAPLLTLLDFNKRLKSAASDIRFRLLLLSDKLED